MSDETTVERKMLRFRWTDPMAKSWGVGRIPEEVLIAAERPIERPLIKISFYDEYDAEGNLMGHILLSFREARRMIENLLLEMEDA